ncbi:ferredoxin reductase-like protein [Polychaeton citri CBS 116435]|uniref:NADH-cytochrome b5 reductase n=1 Tax=Polychaeton citri CBS 116435 TaxID=1314669 RepID=A0A9P4QAW8_9PEZI|nr:ferredoxin reductase-like protein [Polychaeton citri CBS 116435]
MFAPRMFRPAGRMVSQVRRYATEPPKPASGGSNAVLYTLLGAGAIGGGYYTLSGSGAKAPAPAPAKDKSVPPADAPKTFTGGDQGFVSLLLEKVENINHNTKKFVFKLPSEDHVSGLAVASALITKYKGPEMEKPVIRPYTPTSDEAERGYIDLVVKKYPNGPMSEHLHNMEPGQRLDFKGPIPKYPWTENKHSHIGLLAGGTGITPMYQLCRAIFNNPSDKTQVTLVFGNVSEEDILLKKEFEELEQKFPQRFRAFYLLNNPPEGWSQGSGFINKDMLKTVLPGPKEENVKVFVCGPPGLYKAISGTKKSPADQGELDGYLKELGYSKDQVFKF